MQLTTRLPKRRTTTRPTRTNRSRAQPREVADASNPTHDARRGGGPEDLALYSCMCGYAFKAAVTTTVGCPHCGTEQAW